MSNFLSPHPVEAVPEYVRSLAYATAKELDVDIGLALATVLSAMASGVHGLKVVRRPDGGSESLSLFSMVLATSPNGMKRTYKLLHHAHEAQDRRSYRLHQHASRHGTRRDSATAAGRSLRWVMIPHTSHRGLLEALEGVGAASTISAYDGQAPLNSEVFKRHLETLNTLFDGDGRAILKPPRGGYLMASEASLTMLAMVQHDMFDRYRSKYGEYARGIGFFPRTLFTVVSPFAGSVDPSVQIPTGCLAQFEDQVSAYLDAQQIKMDAGITSREEMRLSPGACDLYREIAKELEQSTSTLYWHMQDAASYGLRNLIRLSAVMHAYSGDHGDIPEATLAAAYILIKWYLGQFAGLFPPRLQVPPAPPKPTVMERKAQRLSGDCQAILSIVAELCSRSRAPAALKSEVMSRFREQAYDGRFRAALLRMLESGDVHETGRGKYTRLSIVPQHAAATAGPPSWLQCTTSL